MQSYSKGCWRSTACPGDKLHKLHFQSGRVVLHSSLDCEYKYINTDTHQSHLHKKTKQQRKKNKRAHKVTHCSRRVSAFISWLLWMWVSLCPPVYTTVLYRMVGNFCEEFTFAFLFFCLIVFVFFCSSSRDQFANNCDIFCCSQQANHAPSSATSSHVAVLTPTEACQQVCGKYVVKVLQ